VDGLNGHVDHTSWVRRNLHPNRHTVSTQHSRVHVAEVDHRDDNSASNLVAESGDTVIHFGNVNSTVLSGNSVSIRVKVPAHPAGVVDVTVETIHGTSPVTTSDVCLLYEVSCHHFDNTEYRSRGRRQ